MNKILFLCLAFVMVISSASAQTEYTGTFTSTDKPVEFIASSSSGDSLIFYTSGKQEGVFTSKGRTLLLRYNKDGITVLEDSAKTRLTYIKKGLKDEAGQTYRYRNVKGWEICLTNSANDLELVKGNYAFSGNEIRLTLWVQDGLSNPELIATVVRSLMIKTCTIQQSNEWLLLMVATLPVSSK